ncbi:unnamed protein product [Blepharisma stoltei]|uniref:Uncharacterized protein n=1 Tax=Blepharisma stoltei TaxID=1481888 RepID=A0AAU9KDR0_9CILI|nr:unnamed protein product [Blepharisma stoltei]
MAFGLKGISFPNFIQETENLKRPLMILGSFLINSTSSIRNFINCSSKLKPQTTVSVAARSTILFSAKWMNLQREASCGCAIYKTNVFQL